MFPQGHDNTIWAELAFPSVAPEPKCSRNLFFRGLIEKEMTNGTQERDELTDAVVCSDYLMSKIHHGLSLDFLEF
jgi:hypothetical protein